MDFPAPRQKARCGRGHSRWEQGAETGRQISLAKEWPVPVSERPGFEGIKGQGTSPLSNRAFKFSGFCMGAQR